MLHTGSSVTLSKKEMEDRRKKGLCYWCNDKYTSSHKCRQSQVMMLVVKGHEEDDFVDAEDSLEVAEPEMRLEGSINAIEGREGFSTLRIEGFIKKQKLIFLVDSGSSHNVVHSHVVKKLNLNSDLHRDISVGVAGGSTVKVDKICKALEWSMSGHKIVDDFLIMDIGPMFDVILGAQWLWKLGRLILDMEESYLAFCYRGQMYELHGLGAGQSKVKEPMLYKGGLKNALHAFLLYEYLQCQNVDGSPSLSLDKKAQLDKLLLSFKDVFAEPTSLPPTRAFDHKIHLKEDKAISSRPYRYGPLQKTEIEKQVQDMLTSGIIQPSHSLLQPQLF